MAVPGLAERYVTDEKTFNWTIGAMLVVAGLVSREPLPFAAVMAVVFIIGTAYRPDSDVRETMRSFFGVHKITETSDGQFRVFLHGTTIHGAERLRDDQGEPITDKPPMITYYHPNSPMGVTVKATRQRVGGPIKVAVVGLGTGTFACFRSRANFQVLRDRQERGKARARSEPLQLHRALRAGHVRSCSATRA